MDLYQQAGALALGSRLRRLTEQFTHSATEVYHLYGVDAEAKWFPVMYSLWKKRAMSVTEIAQYIGHTHPSVSKIVKEMDKRGLVKTLKSDADARVNLISLSAKGEALLPTFAAQCEDVKAAAEGLLAEAHNNLWQAVEEMEYLLAKKNFLQRVTEKLEERKMQQVEIVDFNNGYREDFKRLNYEWIERYFQVEEYDRQALEHPRKKILNGGGHILMALYQGEAVGTCALIKMADDSYELAKMAVSEKCQGMGIGSRLGKAAIERARALRAKRLYLESNTKLTPAIRLYEKLGFVKLPQGSSTYARCNIQMEMKL